VPKSPLVPQYFDFDAHFFVRRESLGLNEFGIAHSYEEFPDNHTGVDYRMDESLPFLVRA
jgi:hypothetical protein